MADLGTRLGELREAVQPGSWHERERRVRAGVERSLLVRRKRRSTLAFALAAAVGVLLFVLGSRLHEPELLPAPTAETVGVEPLLRLEDGSEVVARSTDVRLEPLVATAEEVTLRLDAGSARFSVTPSQRRRFRVLAGAVRVEVIGTVFSVSREPGKVAVAVERGRVRVESPSGVRELAAGERGVFAAELAVAAPPSAAAPPALEPEPPSSAPLAAPPRPASTWRSLAQEGDYAAAFAAIEHEGERAVRDAPDDLLLAADASRLGGRPERAVGYLETIVRRHARDARAPLAAFTLGRTLLEQLGRPREAAQAFATARRLDGSGALAEDALAREVESWSRAGDVSVARERATEFLTRYPQGRRAALVRRLGGID